VRIRNERASIIKLLKCGIVLSIFFAGCRDKSAEDHNRQDTPTVKEEHSVPTLDETVAIEKEPVLAETCVSQAVLYYSKGRYDQAISEFTRAIEIEPTDATIFYNRGNAYRAKGQYDLAISDYTKAIEINPVYVEAYYNKAIACKAKGEYDQAVSDLTKALEINPRLAEAYYNRGAIFFAKEKLIVHQIYQT